MLTALNLVTCDHDGCNNQHSVDWSQLHNGSVAEEGQEVRGSARANGWSRSDDGKRDFCPTHSQR
jgi:hypothetical protein